MSKAWDLRAFTLDLGITAGGELLQERFVTSGIAPTRTSAAGHVDAGAGVALPIFTRGYLTARGRRADVRRYSRSSSHPGVHQNTDVMVTADGRLRVPPIYAVVSRCFGPDTRTRWRHHDSIEIVCVMSMRLSGGERSRAL